MRSRASFDLASFLCLSFGKGRWRGVEEKREGKKKALTAVALCRRANFSYPSVGSGGRMAMRCNSPRLLEPGLCSLRRASVPLLFFFSSGTQGPQSGTKTHQNIFLGYTMRFCSREEKNAALQFPCISIPAGETCRKNKSSGCNSLDLNLSGQP